MQIDNWEAAARPSEIEDGGNFLDLFSRRANPSKTFHCRSLGIDIQISLPSATATRTQLQRRLGELLQRDKQHNQPINWTQDELATGRTEAVRRSTMASRE